MRSMSHEDETGCGLPDPGMIASATGMRARDPWEMERRSPKVEPDHQDQEHTIAVTSKVTNCRATDELRSIRATLLVNFGKTEHNRYGFVLSDNGSTHNMMLVALERLTERITAIRTKLESIVCTEGCDRGVIYLSNEGPTHTEVIDGKPCEVYNHENFSPLGDALIELYELTNGPLVPASRDEEVERLRAKINDHLKKDRDIKKIQPGKYVEGYIDSLDLVLRWMNDIWPPISTPDERSVENG